jgi:hypothetical protein
MLAPTAISVNGVLIPDAATAVVKRGMIGSLDEDKPV